MFDDQPAVVPIDPKPRTHAPIPPVRPTDLTDLDPPASGPVSYLKPSDTADVLERMEAARTSIRLALSATNIDEEVQLFLNTWTTLNGAVSSLYKLHRHLRSREDDDRTLRGE